MVKKLILTGVILLFGVSAQAANWATTTVNYGTGTFIVSPSATALHIISPNATAQFALTRGAAAATPLQVTFSTTAANPLQVTFSTTAVNPLRVTNSGTQYVQPKDQYGFIVENTPVDCMRVVEPYRLVGATFSGPTIDPTFWTVTTANTGTAVQSLGAIILTSGTSANATANIRSVRVARYIAASPWYFRAVVHGSAPSANNVRRWGAFDNTDGAFFELNGTAFNVVTRRNGTDTTVASASFTVPTAYSTNATTYEIYVTSIKCYFVIGGVLVHTVTGTTATWTGNLNLPISLQNFSTNSSSTNLQIRTAAISRLGPAQTSSTFYNSAGVAETRVLKYGPGTLHSITVNKAGGSSDTCIVYDNWNASGTKIATFDLNRTGINQIDYDIPFNTGLTYVTNGTAADLTFIFE